MKVYLFSLPLMCLGLGCGAYHNVGVNGYSSTGQTLQIPDASSIRVVMDSNVPNPILEKEVGAKIERLQAKKGNNVETDEANYYLLFDYGIDSGRTVNDTMPVFHSGAYSEYHFSVFHQHSYATYMPYSEVVYTRWLILKLIDAEAYGVSQKAEPLWIGEVTSAGMSSDLRGLIDYMLIAAFEHFGRDTGRRVTEAIFRSDERLLSLTER